MKNRQNVKKKSALVAILILVILLLVAIADNVWLEQSKQETESALQVKIDTLTIANANMEANAVSALEELEVFRGENDSLNKVIEEGVNKIASLEVEITGLKAKLNSNPALKGQLASKVGERGRVTEDYLERIDGIMVKDKLLNKENRALTEKLRHHSKEAPGGISKQPDLSFQTEFAEVIPLKKGLLSNKPEGTTRASKVIGINTFFTLSANARVPAGKKTVSVKIISPDGKVIKGRTETDEKLSTPDNYSETYTLSQEIVYTGSKTPVRLHCDTPDGSTLIPGNYTVEIYVDGVPTSTVGIVLK
jgi:hypothetical protein